MNGDGERVQHLNAYWYWTPQFARRGRRWECCVHNRHTARALTRRTAQSRAEAQCSPDCPMWGKT